MFIDDEKAVRDHRRREGRTVLYITLTALAACVLMFVGLMNVANAAALDDERKVIDGMTGDTHLSLDFGTTGAVNTTGHAGRITISAPALSDGLDTMTTAATAHADDEDATSIDRRLATALGLGALIVVAGVGQLAGRATETLPAGDTRRSSEA